MEKYIVKDVRGKKYNLFTLPENVEFNRLAIENVDCARLKFPIGFKCKYLSFENFNELNGDFDFGNVDTLAAKEGSLEKVNFISLSSRKIVFVDIKNPAKLDLSGLSEVIFRNCIWNKTKEIYMPEKMDRKSIGIPHNFDHNRIKIVSDDELRAKQNYSEYKSKVLEISNTAKSRKKLRR